VNILLLSLSLLASVPVTVRLDWNGSPSAPATIQANRVDGNGESLIFAAASDPTIVALPPGQWFLSAKSAGHWCEPRLVTVSDQPSDVTVELEPATRLRARLKLPRPTKARDLTIHLQTESRTRSVVCPITADRIECDVPSGKQDLVFRVEGHASLFRWSENLSGANADLGTLVFRRGSTFSGSVETRPGIAPVDAKIDVILLPANDTQENDAFRGRKSAARIVTQPNARGFFAFNIAPGRYTVRATAGVLVSEEEEVTVVEGREAVLRHPLFLEPRRTLTINLHPPADPWGKPWRVTLGRKNNDGTLAGETTTLSPADGSLQFIGQLPGSYSLSVHRSEHDEWYSARVDLDGDQTIDVPIATTRVRGSVALGGRPIAALVTFCGSEGVRVPIKSKPDGSFLTLLPKMPDDKWPRVEIESASPHVTRTLADVALSGADTPEASLDLQLPSTAIDGRVVDQFGQPAQNALVDMVSPDGDFKQIESADGTFALTGLAPGRYKITATTREGESDAPTQIDLAADDGPPKEVTIIVEPISRIRGAVRSSFGTVMSAGIFAVAAGSEPPVLSPVPVNAEGRFDIRLPPRTNEVDIAAAAPGFSFRMLRMPVPKGNDADIAVDQQGGALTVEMENARGALRAYLVHNGMVLAANIVAWLANARPLDRTSFEIPQIEAGSYSLCWMSNAHANAERCVSGTLARHGKLTLRL
jgi:hypothetical protein